MNVAFMNEFNFFLCFSILLTTQLISLHAHCDPTTTILLYYDRPSSAGTKMARL